jgi:hypothetical protein
MSDLKNCFNRGKIGLWPARPVFGVDNPGEPPKSGYSGVNSPEAKEQKEAPKTNLENDIAAANQKLEAAIKKMADDIEKVLKNPSSSPAKKAAAQKAQEELAKIRGPGEGTAETNAETRQQTLNKVQNVLAYYLNIGPVEKKTTEYRTLLDSKLSWLKDAEANYKSRVEDYKAMQLDQSTIDRLTAIHKARMEKLGKILTDKFPKISGKESVSLDDYARNPGVLNDFSAGLDNEKNMLSDPNVLKELQDGKAEADKDSLKDMPALRAAIRIESGKDAQKAGLHVDYLYKLNKAKWEKHAGNTPGFNKEIPLAKIQDMCREALKKIEGATGDNAAMLRSMILAQLDDQLDTYYAGTEKPTYTNVRETAKGNGLTDVQKQEYATLLGINPQDMAPPVTEGGPVAAPTETAKTPAVNAETQKLTEGITNPELAALVAGAPSEFQAALKEIAIKGEKIGEAVNFRMLFNKTYQNCIFVKEANGVYKMRLHDKPTDKVSDLVVYKDLKSAMRELADGTLQRKITMYTLTDPQYFKDYEKLGIIDMKGEKGARLTDSFKDADQWTVQFRLDWAGVRDVSGNPIVTARAMPYGGIAYYVDRAGVGLNGENRRAGFASCPDDLFRQMQHLQTWAENFKELSGQPNWQNSPAVLREQAFAQINNPLNIYQQQDRIGRPVYFGIHIDKRTGASTDYTDFRLDWGGGNSTDMQLNPYVTMGVNPDGTMRMIFQYKGKVIKEQNFKSVSQIVDRVAKLRAELTGTAVKPAEAISPERATAMRANPLGTMPAAPAKPTEGPVKPAAAPTAVASTPAAGAASQPAQPGTAHAGAPAAGPANAPAATATSVPVAAPAEGAATPKSATDKANAAAKKAEAAKNTAEAAKNAVNVIANNAKGKDAETVNKAIEAAKTEAEKAKKAADDARKAVEDAKKAADEQLARAEEAKKAADKAEADKAPNSADLRRQSQAETTRLTDANKASKEATEAAAAADKAATEAARSAGSLTAPPAAPATAPAK